MRTLLRLATPTAAAGPRPRATAIPLGLIVAGLVFWLVSLGSVDLTRLSDYGLLPALPITWFVGVILMLAGATAAICQSRCRGGLITLAIVAIVLALYGTVPAVSDVPQYFWVYKHIGVTRYIELHGSVDPEIDIYHRWPGFFAVTAVFSWLAGRENPVDYAGWAEVFFTLVCTLAVAALGRRLLRDVRLGWIAALLFALTNWVGQSYYAPQAFAFTVMFGIYILLFDHFGRPQVNGMQLLILRIVSRIVRRPLLLGPLRGRAKPAGAAATPGAPTAGGTAGNAADEAADKEAADKTVDDAVAAADTVAMPVPDSLRAPRGSDGGREPAGAGGGASGGGRVGEETVRLTSLLPSHETTMRLRLSGFRRGRESAPPARPSRPTAFGHGVSGHGGAGSAAATAARRLDRTAGTTGPNSPAGPNSPGDPDGLLPMGEPGGPVALTHSRPLLPRWAMITLVLVLQFAVVASHQLTPYLFLIGVVPLALLGIMRPWWLVAALGLVTVAYLIPNFGYVQGSFGLFTGVDPLQNVRTQSLIEPNPLPGKEFNALAGQLLSLSIWLLGAVGAIRWLRRGDARALVPVVLLLAAGSLVVGQSYGGEGILRVVLFSTPWAAILAVRAFAPADGVWRPRRALAVLPVLTLLAALFVPAFHGQAAMNIIPRDEVEAAEYLYTNGQPGMPIVVAAADFPVKLAGTYNRFGPDEQNVPSLLDYEQFRGRPLGPDNVEDVMTLMGWYGQEGYLVFGSSEEKYAEIYQLTPPGALRSLERALIESGHFTLWHATPNARIYHYRSPDLSDEQP